MNKPINESKLTIQLEVITELWIRAENQPLDFYEEFAGLLIQFDEFIGQALSTSVSVR